MTKPICPICLSDDLEVVEQRFVEHGTKSPNDEPVHDEAVTIEYHCTRCDHTFDHVGRRSIRE